MYIRGKWLCSEELLILIFLPVIGISIPGYLSPDLWIIFHCGLLESVAGTPGGFPSPVPSLWSPWIIQERVERLWKMELNDVFGADKFGSSGWVWDGCGQEEPNPSGSPAEREIPEGAPGADKWGAVGLIESLMLLSRVGGAGCRGMLEGCVALARYSTALLTFSSIFGVERIPNAPVWDSRNVQHLPWDLLLLLTGISQWNTLTWSGAIVLQERVGLVEVCGVFQGLAASDWIPGHAAGSKFPFRAEVAETVPSVPNLASTWGNWGHSDTWEKRIRAPGSAVLPLDWNLGWDAWCLGYSVFGAHLGCSTFGILGVCGCTVFGMLCVGVTQCLGCSKLGIFCIWDAQHSGYLAFRMLCV